MNRQTLLGMKTIKVFLCSLLIANLTYATDAGPTNTENVRLESFSRTDTSEEINLSINLNCEQLEKLKGLGESLKLMDGSIQISPEDLQDFMDEFVLLPGDSNSDDACINNSDNTCIDPCKQSEVPYAVPQELGQPSNNTFFKSLFSSAHQTFTQILVNYIQITAQSSAAILGAGSYKLTVFALNSGCQAYGIPANIAIRLVSDITAKIVCVMVYNKTNDVILGPLKDIDLSVLNAPATSPKVAAIQGPN
ncbi:hypothetical protein [Candidatus Odyssella thessalonicensis]|uniref:hypothetical protein n=1 Tax=Candidatus Odyssella thessalonicensis TaxID=84647 RepID=UPI000225C159|nr:hypothetical protein [Candidatus Odyssella thessalonicensis]